MAKETTASYSEMNSKLDAILAELQSVSTDVDAATRLYEEGLQLIKQMEQQLKVTGNKITKINAAHAPKKD